MMTIGITGKMGSGKSFVCSSFSKHGIPVYDCDSRVKKLLETKKLREEIIANFSDAFYDGKKWNREYVVDMAKARPDVLDRIGRIVEPHLVKDIAKFKLEKGGNVIVVVESAILMKSRSIMKNIDFTLNVSAPREIAMKRIQARDPHRTEKEIEVLLGNQEVDFSKADYTFVNDGVADVDQFVIGMLEKMSNAI